jgi:hypothetical protein
MRTLVALLFASLTLSSLFPAPAAFANEDDDDAGFRRQLAPAVLGPKLGNTAARKEFGFGRSIGRAWLAPAGELQLDSWVQHRGLLCATYETGIRFGAGENGCADAQWLAPAHWLTSHRQCNNALVHHLGTDTDPDMVAAFDRVTCAQRVVRCSGNCSK